MPQQALAMINSQLTIIQARRLVRYWQGESLGDSNEFVKAMFEHILSRPATADELQTCEQFLIECAKRPIEVAVTWETALLPLWQGYVVSTNRLVF